MADIILQSHGFSGQLDVFLHLIGVILCKDSYYHSIYGFNIFIRVFERFAWSVSPCGHYLKCQNRLTDLPDDLTGSFSIPWQVYFAPPQATHCWPV